MRLIKHHIWWAFMALIGFSGCHHSSQQSLPDLSKSEIELRPNEGRYYHLGQEFTGIAQSHNAQGMLVEEEVFEMGVRAGLRKKWYDHGQISYEAYYIKGKLNGPSRTWWANGNLRSESNFQEGVATGTQKQWYQSGAMFKEINLVNGKEEGMQRAWRENGKLYNNYEARNGRIFGLKRANLCYDLDNEEVQYAD